MLLKLDVNKGSTGTYGIWEGECSWPTIYCYVTTDKTDFLEDGEENGKGRENLKIGIFIFCVYALFCM